MVTVHFIQDTERDLLGTLNAVDDGRLLHSSRVDLSDAAARTDFVVAVRAILARVPDTRITTALSTMEASINAV